MEAASPPLKRDLFWIDFLRAVTMFGVVMIHVAADVITEWGAVPRSWWNAANLYESLARGCVPIFIMISGALLLPKRESYRDFFRKRFNRIAIPFLAWTLLYLLWKKLFYQPDLGPAEALRQIAGNGVYFHLWFLYVLIGLYLLTPLFRITAAYASGRDIFYFLALWFIFSSLLPCTEKIGQLFTGEDFRLAIPIEPAQGFIGYFVLGYFLNQYVTDKAGAATRVIWAVSLLISLEGTFYLTQHFRSFQNALYDNMAPNVVFYTTSVLILIKSSGPFLEKHLPERFKNMILQVSKASFGIYLIHPVFLDTLIKGRLGFTLTGKMFHPIWMIPLTAALVFSLSLAAVRLIQRVPYLRRTV